MEDQRDDHQQPGLSKALGRVLQVEWERRRWKEDIENEVRTSLQRTLGEKSTYGVFGAFQFSDNGSTEHFLWITAERGFTQQDVDGVTSQLSSAMKKYDTNEVRATVLVHPDEAGAVSCLLLGPCGGKGIFIDLVEAVGVFAGDETLHPTCKRRWFGQYDDIVFHLNHIGFESVLEEEDLCSECI